MDGMWHNGLMETIEATTSLNYNGEQEFIKYPKGKRSLLAQVGNVRLYQTGKTFLVVYGLEVSAGLTHSLAACRFGHCALHQAECEGLVS